MNIPELLERALKAYSREVDQLLKEWPDVESVVVEVGVSANAANERGRATPHELFDVTATDRLAPSNEKAVTLLEGCHLTNSHDIPARLYLRASRWGTGTRIEAMLTNGDGSLRAKQIAQISGDRPDLAKFEAPGLEIALDCRGIPIGTMNRIRGACRRGFEGLVGIAREHELLSNDGSGREPGLTDWIAQWPSPSSRHELVSQMNGVYVAHYSSSDWQIKVVFSDDQEMDSFFNMAKVLKGLKATVSFDTFSDGAPLAETPAFAMS
jgi:hypothetical protein